MVAGALVLQDAQTGPQVYASEKHLAVGNTVAVGSKLYFMVSRVGPPDLACYDTAINQLTRPYVTQNFCLLSAKGHYLHFVEKKNGNYYMACWDAVADAIVWSVDCGNNGDALSAPAVTNDVVVYGLIDRVMAVDPATRQVLWTFAHPANQDNDLYGLAVADGNVYFTCANILYGISLSSGKGWQWAGTSPLSDPAVPNGVVFVGNQSGKL